MVKTGQSVLAVILPEFYRSELILEFGKKNLITKPDNVVLKILSKIDPETLKSLSHVSQTWRQKSKENALWKRNTLKSDFPLEIRPDTHPEFGKLIGSTIEPNWLFIYKMNQLLYNGWKTSKPVSFKLHKQISGLLSFFISKARNKSKR